MVGIWISPGCQSKVPQTECFRGAKVRCLTVVGARTETRVQQGPAPTESCRRVILSLLLWLLDACHLWWSLARRSIPPFSTSSMAFSPICVCLCGSFYENTSYVGLGPILHQYNFILRYISKEPIFKWGHIVSHFNIPFGKDTIQPIAKVLEWDWESFRWFGHSHLWDPPAHQSNSLLSQESKPSARYIWKLLSDRVRTCINHSHTYANCHTLGSYFESLLLW